MFALCLYESHDLSRFLKKYHLILRQMVPTVINKDNLNPITTNSKSHLFWGFFG